VSAAGVDFLVVGAGFAGCVCARELADRGYRVRLIERRNHVGGNAHDYRDTHGLLVHAYGAHIFHTNSRRIFEYLSRFTDWRFYEHRVRAIVAGQLYPIPINRTTINTLYGLSLGEEGVREFLERVRVPREQIHTSEDVVLNSVGADLCEKFFRGYTRKQWGLDLSELSAEVAARIPVRIDDDDRYFSDTFQFMPTKGYTVMFTRMLDHPGIEVSLGVDFESNGNARRREHIIYTGAIDTYFGQCFGRLPYRSVRFEHLHLSSTTWSQQSGTVNYPNDEEYTRVTEFKHLTGEQHTGTSIVREYPQDSGEPCYPVPRSENELLYRRYAELAKASRHVTFVGRLARYRYYNMDQVVGAALKAVSTILNERGGRVMPALS